MKKFCLAVVTLFVLSSVFCNMKQTEEINSEISADSKSDQAIEYFKSKKGVAVEIFNLVSIDFSEEATITDEDINKLTYIDKLFAVGIKNGELTDEQAKILFNIKSITSIGLNNFITISDESLKYLSSNKKIRRLRLAYSGITDSSLKYIGQMKQLEVLGLGKTKITDDGLKHITGLENIAILDLSNNSISDKGLEHLLQLVLNSAHLDNQEIYLLCTDVTDEGVQWLENEFKKNKTGADIVRGCKPKKTDEEYQLQ